MLISQFITQKIRQDKIIYYTLLYNIRDTKFIMQKQKFSIKKLPHQLVVEIISFLAIQDLFNLECLPQFQNDFKSGAHLITSVIRKIFNTKDNQMIAKISSIYKKQTIINLPFWGFKTDGGILHNSIPFWVGKAFLKSKQPVVGLMKNTTSTFSGTISQQYHEFVKIVMELSRVLEQYIGKQHFYDTMEETTIRLVVMISFHINLSDAEQSLKQCFTKYKKMLYDYARSAAQFLYNNLEYQVQNQNLIRLDQMANIHSIEFSREVNNDATLEYVTKNLAQTFVIGTKRSHTLKQILKMRGLRVLKTNLGEQQMKKWSVDKFEIQESSKYIVFEPNQQGILMWFDFGKNGNFQVAIPFQGRAWCKEVHVCIVRGTYEGSHQGLTFSYVSLRGIVI